MAKLVNTERHVYLEIALVESEAYDLADALKCYSADFPEASAMAELAARLHAHLKNTDIRYVTSFDHESDLVLKTRDSYCLNCEEGERLPDSDRCQECTDQYGE